MCYEIMILSCYNAPIVICQRVVINMFFALTMYNRTIEFCFWDIQNEVSASAISCGQYISAKTLFSFFRKAIELYWVDYNHTSDKTLKIEQPQRNSIIKQLNNSRKNSHKAKLICHLNIKIYREKAILKGLRDIKEY